MQNKKKNTASPEADIACARRVLEAEIAGLRALEDAMNGEFARCVETLANIRGRVIVTGMGKSGHIGRKIAATLASTGTPSYFVHPGEASHGDLGMITPDDAVLALSNSGETSELAAIVTYTRRFSIPLIGLARRAGSMLVDAADLAIVLPEIPEASPTGAPTTSTTMMLAFGDALAMALLERRGFTPEDFSVFHPGGKLGQAFVQVEELMHEGDELPLVQEDEPMQDVLLVMTAKRFGCAGVLDGNGTLAGIITDGDLRRHMEKDLLGQNAGAVMTRKPLTITPQALAAQALAVMNERSITTLFVTDDAGKPVGILHIHDLLRAGVS